MTTASPSGLASHKRGVSSPLWEASPLGDLTRDGRSESVAVPRATYGE